MLIFYKKNITTQDKIKGKPDKLKESIQKANSLERIYGIYSAKSRHLSIETKLLIINKVAKNFHREYKELANNIYNKLTEEQQNILAMVKNILKDIAENEFKYKQATRLLTALDKLNIKNNFLLHKIYKTITEEQNNLVKNPKDIPYIISAYANFNIKEPWLVNLVKNIKPLITNNIELYSHEEAIMLSWGYTILLEKHDYTFLGVFFNKINERSDYGDYHHYRLYLIINFHNLNIGEQYFTCHKKLWNNIIDTLKNARSNVSYFQKDVTDHLAKMGHTVRTEYKICDFSVDCYLKIHKKEYIIECDGDTYHYYTDSSIYAFHELKDRILKLLNFKVVRVKKSDWDNTINKSLLLEQLIFRKQHAIFSENQLNKLKEIKHNLNN
jgi:L-rhamnose mutarotase